MFRSLTSQVKEAVAKGQTLDSIRKAVTLDEFRKQLAGDDTMRNLGFGGAFFCIPPLNVHTRKLQEH